jgi:hypothetical protein
MLAKVLGSANNLTRLWVYVSKMLTLRIYKNGMHPYAFNAEVAEVQESPS